MIMAQPPEIPRFARNDPSGQIATLPMVARNDYVMVVITFVLDPGLAHE